MIQSESSIRYWDKFNAFVIFLDSPRPALPADKVIPGVGLVVTLYDLLEVGSGSIYPSDGAVHYRSKFRLVIFCPFVGEIVLGKLLKSDE